MRIALILGATALLAGCQIAQQPPEAQLAAACSTAAKAYLTAAGYKAQHKLSAGAISTLTSIEAPLEAMCDPANPPTDLPTALAKVQAYLDQLALVNAGVTVATPASTTTSTGK